jgi:hypothetical protein
VGLTPTERASLRWTHNGTFGGGCQSIFGKGMVAFAPSTYNWVAPDGHEEVINHVEYRSDGPNVIVIPTDPQPLPLIFGFPNHNHAVVAFLGCTMRDARTAERQHQPLATDIRRRAVRSRLACGTKWKCCAIRATE